MFQDGNKLKGYIQRESKRTKMNTNYGYNYYFTRYFLQQLFNDNPTNFVLKGSYSQFINLGKIARPLTDIDIVTFDNIALAKDIIDATVADSKETKLSIRNKFITTNGTTNYKIFCDFDGKTRTISLDLRKAEENEDYLTTDMPIIFSKDEPFPTQAIPLEQHFADKLYAILLQLKQNSISGKEFRRFKDLFDIYNMLESGKINEKKVAFYLQQNINKDDLLSDYELRGRLFVPTFVDENRQGWEDSKKEYQFLTDASLIESLKATRDIVERTSKK